MGSLRQPRPVPLGIPCAQQGIPHRCITAQGQRVSAEVMPWKPMLSSHKRTMSHEQLANVMHQQVMCKEAGSR